MYVSMFFCMMVTIGTEENIELPYTGVSGSYEPSDVIARNRIHVLCKSINFS